MPILNHIPISYIKKAFLWSLFYLKKNYSFEEAIKDVIKRGGDIRSNAAIVGGLIGTVQGKNRAEIKNSNEIYIFSSKIKDMIDNAPTKASFRV